MRVRQEVVGIDRKGIEIFRRGLDVTDYSCVTLDRDNEHGDFYEEQYLWESSWTLLLSCYWYCKCCDGVELSARRQRIRGWVVHGCTWHLTVAL